MSVLHSPNRSLPQHLAPPHIYHLSPSRLTPFMHRDISCHRAPLEESFPCISRNALTLFLFLYCNDNRYRGGWGVFNRKRRMDERRKRPGWWYQVPLISRRRSLATTTMVKVRLDVSVCNALHIFIATPSTSSFSPPINVAANVVVPCSFSASSLLRLIIQLPMLFILLLVRSDTSYPLAYQVARNISR